MRPWQDALHPDPICEVCAEAADVMLWHTKHVEPWQMLCTICAEAYQKKFPKKPVSLRSVVRP